MLSNRFKTAFRYLWNNKVFALINLIGLSLGMCVCFFAFLYVKFEKSYDLFNEKSANIYRLVTDIETPTGKDFQGTSAPMAPAIQTAFPEVRSFARIFLDYYTIQNDSHNFGEEQVAYADSSLFSVFTFPLISGDKTTALSDPYNVVLSASAARKYFGSEDAIGKRLMLDGKFPVSVTAVMKDIPHNSHFRVDLILSMSTLLKEISPERSTNWNLFGCNTYVLLPDGYDARPGALSALESRLSKFTNDHIDPARGKFTMALEPLKNVYLTGKPRGYRTGSIQTGNINNVYTFTIVAIFVLFIACFNFINLTTAFSLQRAKEIGVRKVLGASRSQLIFQFLFDAILLCVLGFALSLILCLVSVPLFNQLSGKIVVTGIFQNAQYPLTLFLLAVLIGFLSGIYPAFFLSGFKPISTLKGSFSSGSNGGTLRKTLVVTQFAVSIILIVATLVVYAQLNFMRTQQLGFKKDHLLVADFHYDQRIQAPYETVKHELTSIPGIGQASVSSSLPGRANLKVRTRLEDRDRVMQELRSDAYFIDYDFLKQYQIELIAGRPFSREMSTDSAEAMIINEAAVKNMGYTDAKSVLGRRFEQGSSKGFIIGVVRNFHFHSFEEQVQPLTIRVVPGNFTFITLHITAKDMPGTISQLEKKWSELAPGLPFSYFFSDDTYDAQYASEERFGRLFICYAAFAIIISCLGLLGLSAYSTAQRTKEVGIRKVLGASVISIVTLLSTDFVLLVALAFIIAAPTSIWLMNKWLQNFAYRIDLSWWMFVEAGLISLLVALITISSQVLKAAILNPIKSMRAD